MSLSSSPIYFLNHKILKNEKYDNVITTIRKNDLVNAIGFEGKSYVLNPSEKKKIKYVTKKMQKDGIKKKYPGVTKTIKKRWINKIARNKIKQNKQSSSKEQGKLIHEWFHEYISNENFNFEKKQKEHKEYLEGKGIDSKSITTILSQIFAMIKSIIEYFKEYKQTVIVCELPCITPSFITQGDIIAMNEKRELILYELKTGILSDVNDKKIYFKNPHINIECTDLSYAEMQLFYTSMAIKNTIKLDIKKHFVLNTYVSNGKAYTEKFKNSDWLKILNENKQDQRQMMKEIKKKKY